MEIIQKIQLSGFDELGEPVIQVMADRSICLHFEFMPPSDIDENGIEFFDDFDAQLSKAIVNVSSSKILNPTQLTKFATSSKPIAELLGLRFYA